MPQTLSGDTGVSKADVNSVDTAAIQAGAITPAKTQMGALPSMVRVSTDNGVGSVASAIRRYLTVHTNQGSDITYADSATQGGLFTINTNGVYSVSTTGTFNAAASVGASFNASNLSGNLVSLVPVQILAVNTSAAGDYAATASWVGYLPAGSLIRPHGIVGILAGSFPGLSSFTITRVA